MKILIVDGDREYLVRLQAKCVADGFSVSVCSSGVHALDLMRQQRFDMLVTNFHMPVTNGLIICREIKRLDPQTKVIIMTDVSVDIIKDVQEYIERSFWADRIIEKLGDPGPVLVEIKRLCQDVSLPRTH